MLDPTNPQPTDSRQTTTARRVVIVGGVAGGASCAARLRRLDETVEILMIDRGPYVSFANCGLPYYVGNVISDERRLLVASREMFHERFNIDVRTDTEVIAIDRNAGTIAMCVCTRARSARSATTHLFYRQAQRRSVRRFTASICLASLRCARSPTRDSFVLGLPNI